MSQQLPSITNADDARLIALIGGAERRVLLLSPGVSEAVADALLAAWTKLGASQVTVILDVDPEVCRLGFGTLGAVERIRAAAAPAGTMLHHQPGVRIGVLVCDDVTLVFSPAPLLIEAGSTQPQRPNAIQLGAVPESMARDLGLGTRPDVERIVGLDPVRPDQIAKVKEDLDAAPPVKFDLARRVRVFTSRFQFVELSMTGCYVSRKKVPIPSSLVGLAKTEDIERQFHAHFDLIQKGALEVKGKGGRSITEKGLQDRRRAVEKKFLVSLPEYGAVVLRANKQKFEEAVTALTAEVAEFAAGVKGEVEKQIKRSREAVVKALLPAVERNLPDQYCKTHGPKPPKDFLKKRLTEDIEKAFGTAEAIVEEMKVKVVFKDVAYESLVDAKFLAVARKAMPDVKWLHEEFEAPGASPVPKADGLFDSTG